MAGQRNLGHSLSQTCPKPERSARAFLFPPAHLRPGANRTLHRRRRLQSDAPTGRVQCVDVDRSEKNDVGDIRLEAFDESKVPKEAAVFKDAASRANGIADRDRASGLTVFRRACGNLSVCVLGVVTAGSLL